MEYLVVTVIVNNSRHDFCCFKPLSRSQKEWENPGICYASIVMGNLKLRWSRCDLYRSDQGVKS